MKKKRYDLLLTLKKLKKKELVNNISTLNTEKNKLTEIKKHLNQMLKSSKFEDGDLISGSMMAQISSFRNNLSEKIDISENRDLHLSKEIKQYRTEINKIEKQKEKIEIQKNKAIAIQKNLEELRKDYNFKPKNI